LTNQVSQSFTEKLCKAEIKSFLVLISMAVKSKRQLLVLNRNSPHTSQDLTRADSQSQKVISQETHASIRTKSINQLINIQ